MVGKLLSLEWKSFTRSASFGKSLGLKIFMIFIAVYFAVMFLFMGIGLYPILEKMYPAEDPLFKLNEYILAWLAFELIFRFFMQSLPVVQIKPLLLQNIKNNDRLCGTSLPGNIMAIHRMVNNNTRPIISASLSECLLYFLKFFLK